MSEKKRKRTNQRAVASSTPLPLVYVYLLFIFRSSSLSLSLPLPLPPLSMCVSLFFSIPSLGLFVSFAGRMSACPTDEFIFVHAFRLHRQEIYARVAVRCELLSASGIIHTPRLLDEELTTGDVFVFRLNAEGLERKKYILSLVHFSFLFYISILFSFLIFA